MESCECQLYCLRRIPEKDAEVIPPPLLVRLKMMTSSRLSSRTRRKLKRELNRLFAGFSKLTGGKNQPLAPAAKTAATGLKAGDLVRVRSREEIEATLDLWKELRGCLFMRDMWQYCGTTQRVLTPMKRFLDECEYQFLRTRGIVLLEGTMCQGTKTFGPCDRACFFFWREEWLEKID